MERELEGERTPCLTLGLHWKVCPVEGQPVGLRLADDAGRLLEVPEEAEARARQEAEAARKTADAARETAEARVRELEAELARRSPGSR